MIESRSSAQFSTRRPVGERRKAVLEEILAGNGKVRSLSAQFGVSEATLRRDVAHLSHAGMATRTYGGAVGGPRKFELSLHEKEGLFRDLKRAIAQHSATLVEDGDTVILDGGSTVGYIAEQLRNRHDLTVITNGVSSILMLAASKEIELISLGGTLRHISQAFVGPLAEAVLERLSGDTAFLGCDAIGPFGICCPTANHAALKSLMAARASNVVVVADSSKFMHSPHRHWVPIERGWTLVTDSRASEQGIRAAEQLGFDVTVVDVDGDPATKVG